MKRYILIVTGWDPWSSCGLCDSWSLRDRASEFPCNFHDPGFESCRELRGSLFGGFLQRFMNATHRLLGIPPTPFNLLLRRTAAEIPRQSFQQQLPAGADWSGQGA